MESFELSPMDVALLSEYLEQHEAEERFLAQQRANAAEYLQASRNQAHEAIRGFEAQAREIPPTVVVYVELHREQIAHDEHRERDASARMLGWCFIVVGLCAFFALMALAYKEGWL